MVLNLKTYEEVKNYFVENKLKNVVLFSQARSGSTFVTNVLSKLIKNVMEAFDGLKGESDEKKFEMFVLIASQKLEDAIATLCMKLFGDFGQELLSISNGNVFASNDRPSAIRYILLKSLFPDGRGGGGYFPPTTRNSFYI